GPMSDISNWLTVLNLSRYAGMFSDNNITMELLPHLTADALKEIGVKSVADRRKLLVAITDLAPGKLESANIPKPQSKVSSTEEVERRHLTVLFCDVASSTLLAKRLDPERFRDLLLSYQNTVAGEIGRMG